MLLVDVCRVTDEGLPAQIISRSPRVRLDPTVPVAVAAEIVRLLAEAGGTTSVADVRLEVSDPGDDKEP